MFGGLNPKKGHPQNEEWSFSNWSVFFWSPFISKRRELFQKGMSQEEF